MMCLIWPGLDSAARVDDQPQHIGLSVCLHHLSASGLPAGASFSTNHALMVPYISHEFWTVLTKTLNTEKY